MSTHKFTQRHPSDHLLGESTCADNAGATRADELQQRLSAVSCPTESSDGTRSTPLFKEEESEQNDSGYASVASSPDSDKATSIGRKLPGYELKYFDIPVSDTNRDRFFDIKVLYTQPLIDAISKKRSSLRDISMKLKYLGDSEKTAKLYIVIQCEKKISKRVKKFFAQEHVKEVLKSDFRVFVLDQELRCLAAGDAIDVLTDSWRTQTLCGMPITMTRGDTSSIATLGGLVMVETSHMSIYGLTAGHPLKRLSGWSPELSEMDGDSDSEPDSESDSDPEYFDVGCELANAGSIGSGTLDKSFEAGNNESILDARVIGTISHDSFSGSSGENYDWALVDLESLLLKPNGFTQNASSQSKNDPSLEGTSNTITWISNGSDPGPASDVIVMTNHGPESGTLRSNGSYLLMGPGSRFVHTYDLTMNKSNLRGGDSGSWVVNETTGTVYGHVVSIDVFGEGQVMPISSTLESIRTQLNAVRVWLPTSKDVHVMSTINGLRALPELTGYSFTSEGVSLGMESIFPQESFFLGSFARDTQDGWDILSDSFYPLGLTPPLRESPKSYGSSDAITQTGSDSGYGSVTASSGNSPNGSVTVENRDERAKGLVRRTYGAGMGTDGLPLSSRPS